MTQIKTEASNVWTFAGSTAAKEPSRAKTICVAILLVKVIKMMWFPVTGNEKENEKFEA